MSFAFTITVEEKEFPLLAFDYDLQQAYMPNGKPEGGVSGGHIRFMLEIPDDSLFTEWMFDAKIAKSGSIKVNRIDQASKFKEVVFKGAYMVAMAESFAIDNDATLISEKYNVEAYALYRWTTGLQSRMDRAYVLACEIMAETIQIDGISHDNKW